MSNEYGKKLVALLRDEIAKHGDPPQFSDLLRKDLLRMMSGLSDPHEAVKLLEGECCIGQYEDKEFHSKTREAVRLLLLKKGLTRRPGKRSRPELQSMVDGLVPLLEYLGVPCKTGEGSLMVKILGRLSKELLGDNAPDVRHLLRAKAKREKESMKVAKDVVFGAFSRGIRPD